MVCMCTWYTMSVRFFLYSFDFFKHIDAIEDVKKKELVQNEKQNNKENVVSEVRSQEKETIDAVAKKEEPRDKSKPISSTPISGTPW